MCYQSTGCIEYVYDKSLKPAKDTEWEPLEIQPIDQILISIMAQCGKVSPNDLIDAMMGVGDYTEQEIRAAIDRLVQNRIFSRGEKEIALLTKDCKTIRTPDGKWYAADDADGRFMRWYQVKLGEK